MKRSLAAPKSIIYAAIISLCAVVIFLALSHIVFAQYTGWNHVVARTDAQRYVQNFRNNRVAPTINGVYFDKNIYEKILAQPECVGIRQYFALNDAKVMTLVLVGVDAKGNDIVTGTIGEGGLACPPLCAGDTKLY